MLLLMQKTLKIKINEKNSQKVKMSTKNKPIVDLAMNGTTPKNWQWFEEVSSNSSVDQGSQGSNFSESSTVNEENG